MIKLNIHEAKTHLSRHLKRLPQEGSILLCKRNVPVAEIRSIHAPSTKKRPIGLSKGRFKIPQAFFDPLPEKWLSDFEGHP